MNWPNPESLDNRTLLRTIHLTESEHLDYPAGGWPEDYTAYLREAEKRGLVGDPHPSDVRKS
jgi:hypothetical protein